MKYNGSSINQEFSEKDKQTEFDYQKRYEDILAKVDEQEKLLVILFYFINKNSFNIFKNKLNQDRTKLMKELSQYKNTTFKQLYSNNSEKGLIMIV